MDRPLVNFSLAVILGMAVGFATGWAGLILAGVLIVGCGLLLLRWGLEGGHFKALLWICFFALGLVWQLQAHQDNSLLLTQIGKQVTLKGLVTEVKAGSNAQTLTLNLLELEGAELKPKEKVLVRLTGSSRGAFSYGQVLEVRGKPENITKSGNPGGFSYRDYLRRRGIYLQVRTFVQPKLVGQGGSFAGRAASQLRERARLLSLRAMGERESSVFRGILFGDTDTLDPADKEVFTTTGVLHAFAVSGSNVAFVLFLSFLALGFLPRIPRLVLTGAAVVFYGVLTGGGGPVVRATIMALVVLGGYGLERKGDGLNSLALAALLMLGYDPQYLTDPGFQLSFAATWGLIELVPFLSGGRNTQPSVLKEFVLFPVAAQIATLPLLAYYFFQISLIGIVANIFVTWFLALIMEVGLAGVCLGLAFPALGELLLYPLNWVIQLTLWLLDLMARVPGAAFWVTKPPLWLVILYYAALVGLTRWERLARLAGRLEINLGKWKGSGGTVKVTALLTGMLLLATALAAQPSPHKLEVEFLDVGQGDSILISAPGNRHYLIDGGPRSPQFDAGKSIVVPYLLAKGIKRLDGVFLTHPHDDHSGGLLAVVRAFPVGAFYDAPTSEAEDLGLSVDLNQEVTRQKIPHLSLKAGAKLQLDSGLSMQVLSPGKVFTGTRSDLNNNSLVLSIAYGRRTFLLTGDIELEALTALREAGVPDYAVIKLPHHGSKYGLDRELFDLQQPLLGVISVGKNNFGQPAPEVSAYWRERAVPALRTDRDGLIAVKTDGSALQVFTGRNGRLAYTWP